MRLYVIRHGETDYNRTRMLQGYREIPLNDLGIRQATRLALRLKDAGIDHIVSSDLRRTVMTASIVASHTGAPITYRPELRERNPGELAGLSYDEAPRFFDDPSYEPPSGETVTAFSKRVREAFTKLAAETAWRDDRIAVVTHGLVCQVFVSTFFGEEQADCVGSRNAGLSIADFDGNKWSLINRNCAAHLEAETEPAPLLAGA